MKQYHAKQWNENNKYLNQSLDWLTSLLTYSINTKLLLFLIYYRIIYN